MYRFVLILAFAPCAVVVACTAELLPEPDAAVALRGEKDSDSLPASKPGHFSATPTPDPAALDGSAPSASSPSGDAGEARLNASEAQHGRDEDAGSEPSSPNEPTRALPPSTVPAPPAVTRPAAIHRYDFSGTGGRVLDSIGLAHGEVRGGAEFDAGGVRLDGVDDYVWLPQGLLSELRSTTLLLWLHWSGGECWQRAFDFGAVSLKRDGGALVPRVDSSFFLTMKDCPSNAPSGGYIDGEGTEFTPALEPLPTQAAIQVGLVFDADASELRVIVDGRIVAMGRTRLQLERLQDDNVYLGRSSFQNDPMLGGQLLEFRIYDRALDEATLKAVFDAGPDEP